MKKTLTAITLLAGAMAGYSQGLLQFNINYNATAPAVGEKEAIYNTQVTDLVTGTAVDYNGTTVYETLGNSTTSRNNPAGSTVYTSALLSGTGYSAELLVGPAGSSLAAGTLLPFGGTGESGGSVLSFGTAAATQGYAIGGQVITLPTLAGYAAGDVVNVAIAAWNNEGGTVTSLAAAQTAKDPWGVSNVATDTLVASGGTPPTPAVGLTGFDLGTAAVISPEPSTIALGVMGASALLFRRRK